MLVNRNYPLKRIKLLMCAVVCLSVHLPLIANPQQGNKPMTWDNFISSIELGRKQGATAAGYIKLVKDEGVDFDLTPAYEAAIRRKGRYLGKKGLDDLIDEIKRKYRSNVSQQSPPTSQPINSNAVIQSITVEGRLTCTLKDGAEIPPAEVPFLPVSDADAYLEGPMGKVSLTFVSPVRFRRQEDNSIVIINRFTLSSASDLQGRPMEGLKTFNTLVIPSPTIVWGKSMNLMKIFEASMTVNGKDVWYYPYKLDVPFQEGPVFRIPLDSLKTRLPNSITQTMINSPGGIQAGGDITINQAPQPRRLTAEQRTRLLEILRNSPVKGRVFMNCVNGDEESFGFALTLSEVLEEAGWPTGGVTRVVIPIRVVGVNLFVNTVQTAPPHAAILQQALKAIGIDAPGEEKSGVPVGEVRLFVGVMP